MILLVAQVFFYILLSIRVPVAPVPQASSVTVESPCNGIASCNKLGTESLKEGDVLAAIKFFKAQVGFSEDAQNKAQSVLAYNNLTVAYIHQREYFRARCWNHLALHLDPENRPAKFNLGRIEDSIKGHEWPKDVSGLYVRYAGRAQWNSIFVSQESDSLLRFHLLAYRIGLAWKEYGPGSYGDVDGKMTLSDGRKGLYRDADFETCKIGFSFKADAVSVEQQGDCGFGYGVRATSDYERICSNEGKSCSEDNLP